MRLVEVRLRPYQALGVDSWVAGYGGRPYFGTFSIFTGGGKTLMALACAERVSQSQPGLTLAVVVPTVALAEQWCDAIEKYTDLDESEIVMLGGGRTTPSEPRGRAIVAVLNTAAKALPVVADRLQPLMLIVDECHRAGAPSFSRVLRTRARFRLGLSATPDREEFDEDGETLDYDEQLVGQSLGGVVFEYTLKEARADGWLPAYRITHHGVSLLEEEGARYQALSRRVEDAAGDLTGLGAETSRARQLSRLSDDVGRAAKVYVATTSERKDLLYRAEERSRVAALIVRQEFRQRGEALRALLFHERIDEATELYDALRSLLPDLSIALENSRLPRAQRQEALARFATGEVQVLVSVKSLIEGIDVPAADIGISVASTSSVRQRVQSLGRVLRKNDDADKSASMHLIYVAETVDEAIYGRADWSDLTGEDVNTYLRWPPLSDLPVVEDGPPRSPLPSEEQIHDRATELLPGYPCPWPGEFTGQEYSVSTQGTVHNAHRRLIANPQEVLRLVAQVSHKGGRFRVTPQYRYVLVWARGAGGEPAGAIAVGNLREPFHVAEDSPGSESSDDVSPQRPGDPFLGSLDKTNGMLRLSKRGGGSIDRAAPDGGRESAFTSGTGRKSQELNAVKLLDAWDGLGRTLNRCYVNRDWQCWYEEGGGRRFLAVINGGLAWPSDVEGSR